MAKEVEKSAIRVMEIPEPVKNPTSFNLETDGKPREKIEWWDFFVHLVLPALKKGTADEVARTTVLIDAFRTHRKAGTLVEFAEDVHAHLSEGMPKGMGIGELQLEYWSFYQSVANAKRERPSPTASSEGSPKAAKRYRKKSKRSA